MAGYPPPPPGSGYPPHGPPPPPGYRGPPPPPPYGSPPPPAPSAPPPPFGGPPPPPPFGSPFESLVPSGFPPGTDPNVVACFKAADRDGSGVIDDKELQSALSGYNNKSFSLRTVHLLMHIFTNYSNARKIACTYAGCGRRHRLAGSWRSGEVGAKLFGSPRVHDPAAASSPRPQPSNGIWQQPPLR